ncbi:MAG: site-specific integrase [Clostridiales bacterium]|nr:site-specific integrase [Clostridiales bacterium]
MPIYNTGKKKDGLTKYRVRVNYTDELGKAHSMTRIAYGQEEAKRLEASLTRNDSKAACNLTVSELIDRYLAAKKYEVRESTLDKSRRILNRYVRPLDYRISRLNVAVLTKWKQGIDDLDLSIVMKKNIYKEFKAVLNWAVKMEYLPSNPLQKVGNFRDAYEQKRTIQFYTPEEYKRYAAAALQIATEIDFYDFYVFFSIAYYTGARKGEIHALKWTDLDGSELHISKSLNQKLHGEDRITPPKNQSSNRTVQLPEPLIEILAEHYERGKQYKGFCDDFYICGGMRPLRDSSLSKMNFDIAARAGLHHIRIHDFRHSHASLLANAGINILEISRRLGHSDIKQTLNTYSHLYPKEEERAIHVLNKIRL